MTGRVVHVGQAIVDLVMSVDEVPTVLVSFGFPYLLYDAPRVPTYVNAYETTETMQDAVVDALMGLIPWNRQSPIDPFCGLEDARY